MIYQITKIVIRCLVDGGISMHNKKGPKTLRGQVNKMMTGDGRKNPKDPSVALNEILFGKQPLKKKK